MATNSNNNANGDTMKDKKEVTICIKTAQNGVSVSVRPEGYWDCEETYVYKNIEEMIPEFDSMISVARENAAKKDAERKSKKGNMSTNAVEEDY